MAILLTKINESGGSGDYRQGRLDAGQVHAAPGNERRRRRHAGPRRRGSRWNPRVQYGEGCGEKPRSVRCLRDLHPRDGPEGRRLRGAGRRHQVARHAGRTRSPVRYPGDGRLREEERRDAPGARLHRGEHPGDRRPRAGWAVRSNLPASISCRVMSGSSPAAAGSREPFPT